VSNITYIGPTGKGEVTPDGTPLNEAIEILEELLEEAKSGKLAAIAVASVIREGVFVTKREFTYKGGRLADLFVATDGLLGRLRKHLEDNA
jgi:hypothetical protein